MFLRLYSRIVVLHLTALAVLFAAEPDRVLLIGVGNYPPPNALPGIDKDIDSMRETALFLGFPQDSIHRLMDAAATLANIQREIQTWLIAGGPKGRVLIYFSGHGSLDGAGRPVLVNYDVKIGNNSLENVLRGNDLGRMIEQIPSQRVLLIVDACHSGRTTDAKGALNGVVPKVFHYDGMPTVAEDNLVDSVSKAVDRNHIVIAACRRTETAGATSGGSILTVGINQAFRELANSPKGITIEGILPRIAILGTASSIQHPEISGNTGLAGINWRGSAASSAKLQEVFDEQVQKASYPVRLGTSKKIYRNKDEMTMSVDVDRPGYMNIVAFSEGESEAVILFPNKYTGDNRVEPGRLSIPNSGAYKISQHLPAGMGRQGVAVYVLMSDKPINLYKQGLGDGVFKMLDETKGPKVEAAGGKGAGRADYSIVP